MNTTTWQNRAIAVILTVVMVFSMLPMSVFAANGAEGTADNPLLISSAEELKYFRDKVNGGSNTLHARLTADIDLSGEKWTPIGTSGKQYQGTFDGNCHTLSGIQFADQIDQGLFGYIGSNGIVQDLFVLVNKENTLSSSGILVKQNKGNIRRCSVEITAKITVGGSGTFGIIASSNKGTIKDCYASSYKGSTVLGGTWIETTVATPHIGGIAYMNLNGTIENCFFRGYLRTKKNADGKAEGLDNAIVGGGSFYNGTVKNSYCFNPMAYNTNSDKYIYIYKDEQSGYGGDIGIHYSSSYSGNKNLTTQNGSLTWQLNNGDESGSTTNNEPWRLHVATNWGNDIHDYPTLRKTDSRVYKNEDGSYNIVAPHFHEIDGEQVEFKQVTSGEELCKINDGYVCLSNDITVAKAIVKDKSKDITTVSGNDVTLPKKWQPTGKVTLCLNGRNIYTTESGSIETMSGSEQVGYGIDLNQGAELNLLNCNNKNTGHIGGSDADSAIYGITVNTGGTLNMENGCIGKCNTGVIVDGGTFNMTGGEIKDCNHIAGIEYRSGSLTLGGHAKVADNLNTGSQNILLIQNDKGMTPTLKFDNTEDDAIFGISVGKYDGSQLLAVTDGRVAVTGENSRQYYKHLFADRFVCGGTTTDYDLYLGDNGAVEIGVRTPHTHCLCGAEHKDIICKGVGVSAGNVGHLTKISTTFEKPWNPYDNLDENGNPTLPTAEGSYYLTRSITIEGDGSFTWEPQGDVKLCLNGHTVTYRVTSRPVDGNYEGWIRVSTDSILTIADCSEQGTVTCDNRADNKRWINAFWLKGGTVNLYGGTVKGFMKAVYVESGTLNMYGGTLTENCSSVGGGGVYVQSGTFNMYGGKIFGNKATENKYDGGNSVNPYRYSARTGGGVNVQNGGSFTMYGGEISGNGEARGLENDEPIWRGGGVYADGNFTMTGGKITGNTASMFATDTWKANDPIGGGLYVGGNFTMYGGEISGNSVNGKTERYSFVARGGGVYVDGKFTMHGGKITENQVNCGVGGGVFVVGKSNISNADISKNTVSFYGNLVYYNGAGGGIFANNECNLTDCKITDNSVTDIKAFGVDNAPSCTGGGGVFLKNVTGANSAISRCTITGNTLSGATASSAQGGDRVGGGGILINQGTVSISNSTITGNQMTTQDGTSMLGGGILCFTANSSSRVLDFYIAGKVDVKDNTSNGKAANLYLEDPVSGGEFTVKVQYGSASGSVGVTKSGTQPIRIATANTDTFDNDAASHFFDDSGRYVARLTEDNTTVQLIPCPHDGGYENGICKICGEGCTHPTDKINEGSDKTVCGVCGQQMAVKVTIGDTTTYYPQSFNSNGGENTLQTLFNNDTVTPSGSTVTLLADDLCAFAFVDDGKNIKLDLNGKNLVETAGNGICVDANSTLTVTGEGSSTPPANLGKGLSSYVFNVRGGTLKFDIFYFGGTFNGIRVESGTLTSPREREDVIHIGTLQIDDADAQVSFKAAAFDKIVFGGTSGSVTLGDLLGVWQDSEGNKVRSGNAFQKADGTFLRYDTAITKDTPIENVKTAACTHDSTTGRTCDYCGTKNLIAAVIDGGGSIATFAAPDDSAETTKEFVGYALNWWSQNGNSKAMKLFMDVVLTDDISLNAIKHPANNEPLKTSRVIDLNGHTFTDDGKNAYGLLVQDLVTLTVKDCGTGKTGTFANATLERGATLAVDGVKVGNITLKAGSKLEIKNGAVLGSVTATDGRLIDFLTEGYAFVGTDGKIKDARAATLSNVTVAEHTHGDYKWDTATHEQVCACGHVKNTDNEAPVFNGIEQGSSYYNNSLTFTVADKVSGVKEVKDGGTKLTGDENGNYTITADNAEHVITATDFAGNSVTTVISVYKVYNVTLVSGEGYTVSGNPTVGHGKDYTFTVTIANGYSTTSNFGVYLNGSILMATPAPDENGVYKFTVSNSTKELKLTVKGVADITAPEAEIKIGENGFKKFLNTITFGLFFKNTQTVTVTASDLGSGVDKAEYMLSEKSFNNAKDVTGDWSPLDLKNGTDSFSVSPKAKGSVYIRVTDKAGNVTVINSYGVVVYNDSAADTESVSFTRLSSEDVSFKVKLNGNTVKSLSLNDAEIDKDLYNVSADGTVTVKNEYLSRIPAGNYTITAEYNPMGEEYTPASGSNSEAPAATTVKLAVQKATLALEFYAPDAVYDGAPYDDLRIPNKPNGATAIQYKVKGANDSSYTTEEPKNVGSYTVRISVDEDENYNFATFTKDFTVSKKKVTVNGTTVKPERVYNGETYAEIENVGTLNGVCGDDKLSIVKGKAAYDNKNVGTGKRVAFTGFTLEGADKANYELSAQPDDVFAIITAKELTIKNLAVKDKQYDGTKQAEIDGTPTLDGVEKNDNVKLVCGTPSFVSENYSDSPIDIAFTAFTLSGTDSGNYTVAQPTGIKASITLWTASGNEYSVNSNDWLNKDFVVTAKDGYLISPSNTATGYWTDKLIATDETDDGHLTFYVKNTETKVISAAVTERYKIDRTAPTGAIALNERTPFQEFIDSISFGLFFNDNVTVKLTSSDDASGVKSVKYYKANTEMKLEEVKKITEWTQGDRFGITAKDTERFIIYVLIEDNAGNVTYLSTDGAEFDTTAPTISGVENNEIYYVTKRVQADDKNLKSVTLNGEPQKVGEPFSLIGDTDAVYTVVATDKADNTTTYTVTMRPISAITYPIKDITAENVKSNDAAAIKTVAEQISAVTAESTEDIIGKEQLDKLKAAAQNCDSLTKRILDVAEESSRLKDSVNAYDRVKVTSNEKADIEKLIADLDALLGGNNLTSSEKDALEETKKAAQELLARITEAKEAAEADEITAVKDVTEKNVTISEKPALENAQKALEDALDNFGGNYTKDERNTLNDRLETVKAALSAINNAEKAADMIKKLPSANDVKLTDKDEIERINEILNTLTETEKAMLGDEAIEKLYELTKQVDALEKTEAQKKEKSTSPKTGETNNLPLWLALLFVCGAGATGSAVAGKKKKES